MFHALPGSSLLGVQERLSAMATKLDLKFELQYVKQSELTSIFLMCDAYYVEVCCQDNGYVASVKLAQANNQVCGSHMTHVTVMRRSCDGHVTYLYFPRVTQRCWLSLLVCPSLTCLSCTYALCKNSMPRAPATPRLLTCTESSPVWRVFCLASPKSGEEEGGREGALFANFSDHQFLVLRLHWVISSWTTPSVMWYLTVQVKDLFYGVRYKECCSVIWSYHSKIPISFLS